MVFKGFLLKFKLIVILVILSVFTLNVHGQNQARYWHFGINVALDFGSGTPVPISNNTIRTLAGSASMSDQNGNLLFYTNGDTIWNSNNLPMPNGQGLSGDTTSTQSALIVKKPGSTFNYYVFTADNIIGTNGLRYSEVDMTLQGGLGDVNSNHDVLIENAVTEKLTAIMHENGLDFWIVCQKAGTNTYHSYLITNGGVSSTPVISSIGPALLNVTETTVGYLKASPDGKKIANAMFANDLILLLDFNNGTGQISNPITSPIYGPYGVEFSPDSKLLYVTSLNISTFNGVFQYNLSSCDNFGNVNLLDRVLLGNGFINSALQIGPDQKIYFACQQNTLGTISYPNIPGPGCGMAALNFSVQQGAGTGFVKRGLPNFQNTWAYNQFYYTICKDDSIDLIDKKNNIHQWALSSNASTVLSNDSIYVVSPDSSAIYIEFDNGDTTWHHVRVEHPVPFSLGMDTTICPQSSILLGGYLDFGSYTWQDSSFGYTQVVSEPGNYWLEFKTPNCCISSDTINISVYSDPEIDLGSDTILCNDETLTLTSTITNANYLWQDGSNSSSLLVTQPGLYWLSLTDSSGCNASDSIEIDYLAIDTSVGRLLDVLTANENADAFQWLDCNNNQQSILGAVNQTFITGMGGAFSVELTVEHCIDTSACIPVIAVAEINESLNQGISFYPNPTSGQITVDLTDQNDINTIEIADVHGKIIDSYVVDEAIKLNMNINEPSGLYYILLIRESGKIDILKVNKL